MGKFYQCLTELSACNTIIVGYYSLMFLFQISEKHHCIHMISSALSLNDSVKNNKMGSNKVTMLKMLLKTNLAIF